MPGTPPLLDAVIDRILHNRLQQQLEHVQLVKLRLHFNAVGQLAAVPDLLDFQVTYHMFKLIGQRNKIAPFTKPQPEQLG
ncbi:hypothetical protein D3C75_937810 [compost metagenome]